MTISKIKLHPGLLYDRIIRLVSSKKFFALTLVWFMIQTSWIAISSKFDAPHDEKYHFGMIERYSHTFLPFIHDQPSDYSYLGDTTRYVSYLYHYLMSFPYRVIAYFADSQTARLIGLRMLNVAIGLATLFILRKLVIKLTNSKPVAHLTVFMFSTTTIYVFMSGSISYENLTVLFLVLIMYLAVRRTVISGRNLMLIISLILLGTLVKYSFIPLILPTAAFVLYKLGGPVAFKKRMRAELVSMRAWAPRLLTILLTLLLCTSVYLFSERYIQNQVRYGSYEPDCVQVHSIEECTKWPPYRRNLRLAEEKSQGKRKANLDVVGYVNEWYEIMRSRTYGIYVGWDIQKDTLPLRVFSFTAMPVTLIAVFAHRRKFVQDIRMALLLVTIVVYCGVLLVLNFSQYKELASIVAVQSRYLIPVYPLMYVLTIYFSKEQYKDKATRAALIVLTIVAFSSGGLITYIQRTSNPWYVPVQKVLM